jgi:hypothetical protein
MAEKKKTYVTLILWGLKNIFENHYDCFRAMQAYGMVLKRMPAVLMIEIE